MTKPSGLSARLNQLEERIDSLAEEVEDQKHQWTRLYGVVAGCGFVLGFLSQFWGQ